MNYTLLLDEVGKKMEKAYKLKQRILSGEIDDIETSNLIKEAIADLKAAPVEKCFWYFLQRSVHVVN